MKYKLNILGIIKFILIISLSQNLFAKEFKLISLDEFSDVEKLKFQDKSGPQTLIIRKYYPNVAYPIPENKLIHFYGVKQYSEAHSKKPMLRLSFEELDNEVIVFIKKSDDDNELIEYEYYNNSPEAFPEMSTLFLNLSDDKVVASLGDKIIKLNPNGRSQISMTKNERGSFSSKVIFATQKKDKSINYFHTSFWRIPKGHKSLCIIDYDAEQNLHLLKHILL